MLELLYHGLFQKAWAPAIVGLLVPHMIRSINSLLHFLVLGFWFLVLASRQNKKKMVSNKIFWHGLGQQLLLAKQ